MEYDYFGKKKKEPGLGFFSGLFVGVLLTSVVVVMSYVLGRVYNPAENIAPAEASITEDGIINSEFLRKVTMIENLIEENYYLGEVNVEDLREGAYEGMVYALGDIYSVYYTPEEAAEVFADTEGTYYGIGAYVQMDEVSGYVMITGTIKNTPAEEAGLQPGDILYMVEGEDMAGMDTTQVVKLIQGEEGTYVHLTLARDGDLVEVDVERRKIDTPTVEYEMLDEQMGYIYIQEFDDVTVKQFNEAVDTLLSEGMEGLVLDLRGNPGGSLYSVVDIADRILGDGLILYTEDKQGYQESYYSDAEEELDIPIVVLVDGNSASAAEVLSGALKDHGKAILVGTTTFGKGIVQTIRTLPDGSAVKLTISAYYTPSGTNIHGTGIEPDVYVDFDYEAYLSEGRDNQLETAEEELAALLAQ